MDKDREIKQNYLRIEILEKNLSPDEFMKYCEGIKGAEIDAYTLEELEKIVAEFTFNHNEPAEEASIPEPYVEAPVQVKRVHAVEVNSEYNNPKRTESSAYSISAIKMHDNALSLEDVISVKVGK